MELSEAPTGYHSVHGIKSSAKVSSDFKGDEYVVYSTSQQRIRYNGQCMKITQLWSFLRTTLIEHTLFNPSICIHCSIPVGI